VLFLLTHGFGDRFSNGDGIHSLFFLAVIIFGAQSGGASCTALSTLARMAASISLAISGCSFRKSLLFSRPWPSFHIPIGEERAALGDDSPYSRRCRECRHLADAFVKHDVELGFAEGRATLFCFCDAAP